MSADIIKAFAEYMGEPEPEEQEVERYVISKETRDQLVDLMESIATVDAQNIVQHLKGARKLNGGSK